MGSYTRLQGNLSDPVSNFEGWKMSIINGKRILVVEDETGPRESIRMIFETYGAIVRTAEDGYGALKILETNSFDLITTCLHMEGLRGRDLCKEIHARGITTPIVIISALIFSWVNYVIEGVVAVIAKPFDLHDLRRHIEKALEGTHKVC
jgi:CheY-like chemotaxis protein